MERRPERFLFAKNADQPYYPASITKILTALIVLEHCSLDEEVTFSHDDVYNVEAGAVPLVLMKVMFLRSVTVCTPDAGFCQ